jgi:hypothetical protein
MFNAVFQQSQVLQVGHASLPFLASENTVETKPCHDRSQHGARHDSREDRNGEQRAQNPFRVRSMVAIFPVCTFEHTAKDEGPA